MRAGNELNQIRLRKYQNRLTVSGTAVIAFGVWGIIRAALFFLTQSVDIIKALGIEHEVKKLEGELPGVDIRFISSGIFLGFVFLIMALDVLLRYYIGRSAILEGRGLKKKSIVYIVIAVIMIIILIIGFIPDSAIGIQVDASGSYNIINTALTTRLLDLSSLLALLETVISAIRVRQLRDKLGITIIGQEPEDMSDLLDETGWGD